MAPYIEPGGPVFHFPFRATALTTTATNGMDLFVAFASTSPICRFAVKEFRLANLSDAGDANAQVLGIAFFLGSTGLGAGSAIAGVNPNAWANNATAKSSVTGPSSTVASTTSATCVLADGWNVAAPYLYMAPANPKERIILPSGGRFHIQITAPSNALTANGTLVLQELGAGLPS